MGADKDGPIVMYLVPEVAGNWFCSQWAEKPRIVAATQMPNGKN